MLTDI